MKNICILGLGSIAQRVAKGIQYAKNARLYAVCSRSQNKAGAFAKQFSIPCFFDSMEIMLEDKNVDVVYICTPNTLHKEHILSCLSYGKHVICEKPMVLHTDDLIECFAMAKAKNCFLMETHKCVFTPLNQKIHQMIQEGAIGKVHLIEAQDADDLLVQKKNVSSWHFEKEGGGCLYDIGVYPIAYANFMAQSSIKQVQLMDQKADDRFTVHAQANILYENGIMAHIATSWVSKMENTAHIYGEKGSIHCHNFWKNREAVLIRDGKEERITVSMQSDFTGEVEHAIECIEQGYTQSKVMGQDASEQVLKVIEA
ncbi:Gfo/Idh/MocA family protein [Faecalicoccus pleomorphus]|uniref:Gfo/Idh/MocA family protein n=1 Tax=Faecalicoccus pleomorphus TaxID=1323 RepID=UPI00196122BD|nr:Gfo/Idh/MocA family oxidoreductase [Faecalicoccus pleomorphus]MBM6808657.1 Gfo/Idh/MocA family oxidoreductase [Faecalicoccus pleomorphus]